MQDVPKMLGLVPTPVLWLPVVMKIQRLGGSCIYRLMGWSLWREITEVVWRMTEKHRSRLRTIYMISFTADKNR